MPYVYCLPKPDLTVRASDPPDIIQAKGRLETRYARMAQITEEFAGWTDFDADYTLVKDQPSYIANPTNNNNGPYYVSPAVPVTSPTYNTAGVMFFEPPEPGAAA